MTKFVRLARPAPRANLFHSVAEVKLISIRPDHPLTYAMLRLVAALVLLALPLRTWAACAPVASGEPRVWRIADEDPTVTITFLGHASFLIETPGRVRAVTDYSGVFTPAEPPDLVTMNHAHASHYTLQPDPRIGIVLHGWQEGSAPPHHDVTLRDLRVTNLATNIRTWDGGTEINGNSIFIFETAGLCIAHLGHLHHLLDSADLDALGHIDVLMVMVDGAWSLGQADARSVVEQIHPRIVLPMHYFTMATLARFLDMMRTTYDIEMNPGPTVTVSRLSLPDEPTVIALPGPH
jgi:L-ascorbate metabolism protein UlaG (beta-lactamase superfamily)